MFAEDISEDVSEDRRYHFYTGSYRIYGYLRNLRGRLLSPEKFSEVFALWVFTLKLFPVICPRIDFSSPSEVTQSHEKKHGEKRFSESMLASYR